MQEGSSRNTAPTFSARELHVWRWTGSPGEADHPPGDTRVERAFASDQSVEHKVSFGNGESVGSKKNKELPRNGGRYYGTYDVP